LREQRALEEMRDVEETVGGREDQGLLRKQRTVERIEGHTMDRGS
jgi:hypothetical protein